MKEKVVGIDEAGRGALAGPVVAAAVVLDPAKRVSGLADSKVLSAKKRSSMAKQVFTRSYHWAIGYATPQEIDRINILQATLLAMQRAYQALDVEATEVLIDGMFAPELPAATNCIIKGDATVPSISAASIVAKVIRDQHMLCAHRFYEDYGFDKNKGYPTARHISALEMVGSSRIHRKSFGPVARLENRLL